MEKFRKSKAVFLLLMFVSFVGCKNESIIRTKIPEENEVKIEEFNKVTSVLVRRKMEFSKFDLCRS